MIDLKALDLALIGLVQDSDTDSLDTDMKSDIEQKLLQRRETLDPLTRVYRRDFFDLQFDIQWKIAVRKQESMVLFFIDIDRFRSFNEKNDSRSGDYALQKVAKTLKQLFRRGSDFVARYKSDQFIVLAADMTQEQAKVQAEKICDRVYKLKILDGQADRYLSVCVGHIVHIPLATEKPQGMLKAAYQNLKHAKSTGIGKVFG